MLSRGETVLPAGGIGRISEQLAAHLPTSALRLRAPADELLREDGRIKGVCSGGEEIEAETVVLAVPAPEARRLAGVPAPDGQVSTVTLYFGGNEPLWRGRKILLNANPDAWVNNCAMLSNIAPGYTPEGKHLLSASVLGLPELPDDQLASRALEDIARLVPPGKLTSYEFLGTVSIPYAQFPQPPGFRRKLPGSLNPEPGLYLAGEYFRSSSINGAMASGEATARAVLGALPTPAPSSA